MGLDADDEVFEHIRDIWDLTQDPNRGFREKLQLVFATESDTFGLPYGFLSRTDPAADTQTIQAAHGSHDLLQAEKTAPLSESYCRHTLRAAEGCFHIHDATAEGFTDDPAYDLFHLESYVGSTVEYDGHVHGTLCFAGSEPLDEPLSTGERRMLDLLSTWVSSELGRERVPSDSDQQARQVDDLASVISHDLRNPLQVAQSHVELLGSRIQESLDHIDAAHRRMDDIIDNILALARIDEPVTNPETVDLDSVVAKSWTLVETDDATLTTDLSGMTVDADEDRLRHLLENLLRNAVEHGGPSVTVTVGTMADGFYVADDGPGIPADERTMVLEPGYSTVPEGTGFGLNIVRRIAAAHGWSVQVTASDDGGARFEFTGLDGTG